MKKALASDPKFAGMKLVQVAYGEESEQVISNKRWRWSKRSQI